MEFARAGDPSAGTGVESSGPSHPCLHRGKCPRTPGLGAVVFVPFVWGYKRQIHAEEVRLHPLKTEILFLKQQSKMESGNKMSSSVADRIFKLARYYRTRRKVNLDTRSSSWCLQPRKGTYSQLRVQFCSR